MRFLRRSARRAALAFLATLTAALVFAASALAAANITLTFVRHAESQANAAGIIDTKVPGPHITTLGEQEAAIVAAALAAGGHDGLYASDMIRTQETAAPLAALLGKQVTILPGLHEIDAGIYEGSSEDSGLGRLGYALTPALWMLGARFVPMFGSTDANGNVFQARVNGSVQAIYDSGNQLPVAFAHGATIMFWTMMNVDNPDLSLLLTHQLPNTGVVVLEGNPEDGWTLVNWDGIAVDRNPSFLTKMFVNVRDLLVAPQEAMYAVEQAIAGGHLGEMAHAFVQGILRVAAAPLKFVAAVARDVLGLVFKPAADAEQPVVVEPEVVTLTADRSADEAATVATPPDTGAAVTTADDGAGPIESPKEQVLELSSADEPAAPAVTVAAPEAVTSEEAGDPAAADAAQAVAAEVVRDDADAEAEVEAQAAEAQAAEAEAAESAAAEAKAAAEAEAKAEAKAAATAAEAEAADDLSAKRNERDADTAASAPADTTEKDAA